MPYMHRLARAGAHKLATFSSPLSFRSALLAGLFEALFLGVFTILFIFTGYHLLFVRSTSRLRCVLCFLSAVMYATSVSHWAIYVYSLSKSLSPPGADQAPSWKPTIAEGVAAIYLPCTSTDAIVVWRAWVICERRTRIFIPPFFFLLALIGVSIASIVLSYRWFLFTDTSVGDASLINGGVSWILTILTNVWATAAVGVRAWSHRQFIKKQLGEGTARSKAEKMLALLIESGALYICVWIVYILVYFGPSEVAKLTFDAIIIQLVGIYPTLVIALTSMRSTLSQHEDVPINIHSGIAFAEVRLSTASIGSQSSGRLDVIVEKAPTRLGEA
ncbi:hypothetical protein OF83DRAFT_1175289 [Amylostereum chailletii]|nr:hypothetical protein OF83DRAFT_1175289 [Amylostereum chailletii]